MNYVLVHPSSLRPPVPYAETVRCDRAGCGAEFTTDPGKVSRDMRSHYWKAHDDGIAQRFVVARVELRGGELLYLLSEDEMDAEREALLDIDQPIPDVPNDPYPVQPDDPQPKEDPE